MSKFKIGDIVYVRPGCSYYHLIDPDLIQELLGEKLVITELCPQDCYHIDYYDNKKIMYHYLWTDDILMDEIERLKYYRPCGKDDKEF